MADAQWSLLFKLEADSAEVRKALDDLDRRLTGFEGSVNSSSRNVGANLRQMGRGVGQVASGVDKLATRAAIAGAGLTAFAVTTAASFEQAGAGVRKTVDGSRQEVDALLDELKEMTRTTPVAFEELAGIAEMGGALGIARADLVDFTDVIARLSVSTDLTAEAAATAFGQLANVLDMSSEDMRRFGDSLVALGNDGASTESQIVGMAARFGAAGKQADLSNEQILALASTVASVGIEVEAGGSSLARLFNQTTLNIGTASDEAVAFADALDVSLGELATRWDRDANGTFIELLKHLDSLDKYEATSLLEQLGINNVRDMNAIMLLAADVEEYERQLAVATESTGALARESDAFYGTTQGMWQTVINNVRLAADTIGTELLPVVNEVMDDFIEWLTLPQTQRGLESFARDLAGSVRSVVTEIRNADLGPLLETMKAAAAVAKAGFDAFNALPSGVKGLVLAIVGVNKVTGGALTDIAKGLSNVLGGALKLAIPALNRGITPANPMFVKDVSLPGNRIPGGPTAPGGGRLPGGPSVFGSLLRGSAPLIAAALAQEFSDEIVGFGTDLHEQLGLDGDWNPFRGLSPDDWQWPLGSKGAPDWAQLRPDAPRVITGPMPKVGAAVGDTTSGWETRFGDKLEKLATNEIIEHLARTNEMGFAGVGTSFQVGLANGLDPLGDTATQILARAEDPLAPPVMAEIKGHLLGLEEIQQQYLNQGDVHLAAKVQTNIDTLHTLIGTADANRAVTAALAAQNASSDAAMLATASRQTGLLSDQGGKILGVSGAVNGVKGSVDAMHSTLAGKNFGNVVNKGGDTYIVSGGGKAPNTVQKFHEGTWDVPMSGLAMLEQGEMVVPAFDAAAFRDAVSGGDQPSGDTHLHVEVQGLLRAEEPRDLVRPLRALARTGHMAPRQRYATGTRR